jgi:RNA polymerase sigma-70 factor (ECF subfamily)
LRFEAVAAEVYEPLQRYLRRRSERDEADDIFGDVLLTIWRRIDDVPDDAVLPWSYGVARNLLANRRRSARRHLRLVSRMAAEPRPASDEPPDPDPALSAALERLGEADRELIRLWAWEQLEPREIATVLGTTANAVSLRLTRAKKKISDEINRQNALPPGHEGIGTTGNHPS